MQINLSEQEAAALREALSIYLTELKREIVHTDKPAFRAELTARERLLERIVADLSRVAA